MGGSRRGNNDDAFSKIKFKIPPFDGKYDPDAYITREIAVDKNLHAMNFLRIHVLELLLVSSLILLLFGGLNTARNILPECQQLGML